MSDGLYECTTTTACRARARRNAGPTHDGRGRIPSQRGLGGAGLGVAYVIGPDDEDRGVVEGSLRDLTDLSVVCGAPDRATRAALASRNVRLIAVAAGC
ncbi:MAG TPA: hypothetical protein VK838_06110, partial [Candidatus Limnocylindrales bacterium]|nr:hypothetical protein [Candidatus Limnocylindrales bacterium]